MRFASLGSGSEGNGLVVESGGTRVLIDCGFGVRGAATRLGRLGLTPSSITAILVTHEHSDHVGGVPAFAARHDIPVWATFGTLAAVSERFEGMPHVYGFDSHDRVRDRRAGDRAGAGAARRARAGAVRRRRRRASRLGVLTDIGVSTPHVEASLSGCDALVLECNHDLDLLENGDYPYPLKQRIAGRLGHLHNEAAADILARIDTSGLKHIIAAHLSQQNNTPELARTALSAALGCPPDWIGIADQATGFDWRAM